jgi:hypothetical protein
LAEDLERAVRAIDLAQARTDDRVRSLKNSVVHYRHLLAMFGAATIAIGGVVAFGTKLVLDVLNRIDRRIERFEIEEGGARKKAVDAMEGYSAIFSKGVDGHEKRLKVVEDKVATIERTRR